MSNNRPKAIFYCGANGSGKSTLRRINEIVQSKRSITADTALRPATYFGTDSQSWLNLQSYYDAEQTRAGIKSSELEFYISKGLKNGNCKRCRTISS